MMRSAVCASEVRFAPYRYTGKERDTESGNDYFEARYYSSAMGRFMSPDWSAKAEPVPYAKLDDPQSLNLYAYVGNNPLSRVDRDGHVDVAAMCKGKATCNVQVQQTALLYSQHKNGKMVLDATLKVTTNFTVTSNDKGAITSVAAETNVQLVSGAIQGGADRLNAMAQTIADVQGFGVTSGGIGPNTTQMLTAVADVEGKFGTEKNGRGQPANKDPSINPLQLSGRRETWNRDANILGGIGVLRDFGGSSDPQGTYQGFRGRGQPTAPFSDVYSGIDEQATQH